MPLEQRRSETTSIFLINDWSDGQGSLEWKRFYDFSEPENAYISTKHNTWGLSGRYYYQFPNPDTQAKLIPANAIDKLKKLLPSINEAQELAKVQSLKDICGRWIAKQGTDLEELKDLLPPDLLKFVSFLKKQHSIRNSKDQKLQLSNDRMQIEEISESQTRHWKNIEMRSSQSFSKKGKTHLVSFSIKRRSCPCS
eukprot:TRINITY_DN5221_c0_g1_i3.p1 TRINITY_DN5221_c0_g1~~TRINITY_DN5221_c0_g1_i3.p1  ORF type:complete len:196 (-),score=26.83 TRINITY_DN5221_c0_g1_i3:326-913(-)